MHAYVLVVVGPDHQHARDVEELVAEAMAPFCQDDDGENAQREWDWYQVGGRYTGRLDGYDPDADPANVATCWLCGGSGTRTDETAVRLGISKCNHCNGEGKALVWASQRAEHAGDVQVITPDLVEYILQRPPYAFVAGGEWVCRETYHPDEEPHFRPLPDFVARLRGALELGCRAVVVDAHS